MDMIERVAIAMHSAREHDSHTAWDDMPPSYRAESLRMVMAGIEAMRIATADMLVDEVSYEDTGVNILAEFRKNLAAARKALEESGAFERNDRPFGYIVLPEEVYVPAKHPSMTTILENRGSASVIPLFTG